MSTTLNSASTGAERHIRIDHFAGNKNVMIFAEIPEVDVYFNISIDKAELAAAVAKETDSVLIEPKRVSPTRNFNFDHGIYLPAHAPEKSTAGSLRQAAAHFLALAAEKEAEEAAQNAEITRITQAISPFLESSRFDALTADEIAKELVKAGLTVKEEA